MTAAGVYWKDESVSIGQECQGQGGDEGGMAKNEGARHAPRNGSDSRKAEWDSGSTTGEDGTKSHFAQDARDSVTVIALNLDPSFLHGASGTTSLLHFLR